mmetsp:Transcript_52392/g.103419  ORF Transcript_52392/g.103419 Transcript_52392/m.103419 type:complete len:256 (+) Transcript_52392:585-1352(+)
MINEAVLWGRLFRLERSEQGFFGTENLHGAGRVLRQVHQRASLRDQPRANELSNHVRQVRRNGVHPQLQVLGERCTILCELDNAFGEGIDVGQILICDLRAHGGLSRRLNLVRDVLGHCDLAEVCILAPSLETHEPDNLRVCQVVSHDLAHLRKMPAIPLTQTHGKVVELFVEIVQQAHRLHDHHVDFVRGELQLKARQRVGKAERHGLDLLVVKAFDQGSQVHPDPAHDLLDAVVKHRHLYAELLVDINSQRFI